MIAIFEARQGTNDRQAQHQDKYHISQTSRHIPNKRSGQVKSAIAGYGGLKACAWLKE